MKKRTTRAAAALMCLVCVLALLSGCGKNEATSPALAASPILHEEEFGGIYIKCSIEDFGARGFAFGDSVDIRFSNGYTLEDLPYYNGYYTMTGEPLLVGYPGYPYIRAGITSGDDLWLLAGVQDSDTAEVTLREQGKYLAIQTARDIHYTDERADYASDAVFANFRNVRVGGIAENTLYRGASPCDDQHCRAAYADALIAEAGVNCILDLADTAEKLEAYIGAPEFASPYFLPLYERGSVIPVALNMNYTSDAFRQNVASGLAAMAEQAPPYYVHCTEGKDRTGFVCILLEALCGADYDEIEADYMVTYDNYYGITKDAEPEKYETIAQTVFRPMIESLAQEPAADPHDADYAAGAAQFLLDGGMLPEQVDALKARLTAN